MWQVRSQFPERRSLTALVSSGATGLGGPKPRKGGDMACVRGPLGAFCLWQYHILHLRICPLSRFLLSGIVPVLTGPRLFSMRIFQSLYTPQMLQFPGRNRACVWLLAARIRSLKGVKRRTRILQIRIPFDWTSATCYTGRRELLPSAVLTVNL